ncbi:MAG: SDR family oxidoreductase [Anaerolineae bacterium]|nr:SDR family oxidoreductase [Anaerolineae bacterium]
MKAFVTGGTGLLGSNLVCQLVEQGWEVTVLVRSPKKAQRLFRDLDVTYVEGDMLDVAGFASHLRGIDVLFHAAAYFREYYQPGDHWQMLEAINIRGTIQLLEAAEAAGVGKVIYVSSSTVIGPTADGTPSDETTPPNAHAFHNLYRKSKVLAEQAIATFQKTHTLPVVLILPTWMFGPRDVAPTNSGRMIQNFLDGGIPALLPGGTMIVDARDVAQAMIAAVEKGNSGERYIIGGAYASLETVASILSKISGQPMPRLSLPYPLALAFAWVSETLARLSRSEALVTVEALRTLQDRDLISSAKAMRELGAAFRPLETTLRDEIAWYRQQTG